MRKHSMYRCVICGKEYPGITRKYKPTCSLECGMERVRKNLEASMITKQLLERERELNKGT